MKNFKDFINQPSSDDKTIALVAENLKNLISTNINLTKSFSAKDNKKDVFISRISSIIKSDDFLNEFSDKIDKPQIGEKEDEFVLRAKNSMREILNKKLK